MQNMLKYLRKVIPHNSPLRLWYTRILQVVAYISMPVDTTGITLIGITGTDGKTTTVEMLAHMLGAQGVPYISSSSLEVKISGHKLTESKRTTPSLSTLKSLLKKAVAEDVKVVVIEVSSHALVQWRVLGIKFDAVILTNITHEHLNFHKTRARYAAAKKLLFTKHLKPGGIAILNSADEYGGKWLVELARQAVGYEQPDATVDSSGTHFNYDSTRYTMPMLGAYNASNALAGALAVSSTLPSISTHQALETMRTFTGIPGRMQLVSTTDAQPTVLVDFALTQRAMASSLSTARELASSNGNVLVVFGATGGQHDATVRPGLAHSVAKLANVAIVTDDEPYDGDPVEIRRELVDLVHTSAEELGTKITVENMSDRRMAIHKALELAKQGDVIVVSGMGHYTTRTVSGVEMPWNDAQVITEELAKL